MKGRINDLDAIEIAGTIGYEKEFDNTDYLPINKNFYKIINYNYSEDGISNGGLDVNVFERYDDKKPTGEVIIAYQGSDFNQLGDTIADFQLAGTKVPTQYEAARKFYTDLKTKYNDANNLNYEQFYKKHHTEPNQYQNKQIKMVTGNSLAGGLSQYVGIFDPSVQVVTTDTAPLPGSIAKNMRKDIKNIRNYHSSLDILTMLNKGSFLYNNIAGEHINLHNGVLHKLGISSSHTGYNIIDKKKRLNGKYDPKNVVNKPIYVSKHGTKIYADMDKNVPIFVWSGDALGAGAPQIKLDKAHLSQLHHYVEGRLTEFVDDIRKKMNDADTTVSEEHARFQEKIEELEHEFEEITKLKDVEHFVETVCNNLKNQIISKIDGLNHQLERLKREEHFLDFIGMDTVIDSLQSTLTSLKNQITKIATHALELFEALRDIQKHTIRKMFISPIHGFEDGVREEITEHYDIVLPNIDIIHKQIANFGAGIQDILTQMSNIDDNVMVNNVSINTQATHQTQQTLNESNYMMARLTILETVIINGIRLLSINISTAITAVTAPLIIAMTMFDKLTDTVIQSISQIERVASKIPFAGVVTSAMHELNSLLKKINQRNEHMMTISIRILTIPYITEHIRPLLEQALLTNSTLENVRIMSTSSEGNIDMLITELNGVITGLKSNKGNAIDSLAKSTRNLITNLNLLKEQISRTSSY